MKRRLYIIISILTILTLSVMSLNKISEANYEFLNSKYRKFIDIEINSDSISFQVANKIFSLDNFFSKK